MSIKSSAALCWISRRVVIASDDQPSELTRLYAVS